MTADTHDMIAPIFNQFASDNYAGICPEAWEAMGRANAGYAQSYGNDAWTTQACAHLRPDTRHAVGHERARRPCSPEK